MKGTVQGTVVGPRRGSSLGPGNKNMRESILKRGLQGDWREEEACARWKENVPEEEAALARLQSASAARAGIRASKGCRGGTGPTL